MAGIIPYETGDIVEMKKKHPCGSSEWEILKAGADIKMKCLRSEEHTSELQSQWSISYASFFFSLVPGSVIVPSKRVINSLTFSIVAVLTSSSTFPLTTNANSYLFIDVAPPSGLLVPSILIHINVHEGTRIKNISQDKILSYPEVNFKLFSIFLYFFVQVIFL